MERVKDIRIAVEPVDRLTCTECGASLDAAGREPFTSLDCPACSASLVIPARFGPFLLLRLLNVGGMGAVFCAEDVSLGRRVALKVMLKALGEDPEFVERFKREAQAAARLNHPNVAQIHSFGQEKGLPYIVMELVSGQRLDKVIEAQKSLDQAFVLGVGLDVAEGLSAADEIGLVHGDIKPENILLDEKGHAKLVDFGIAAFAREKQATGGVWGTPYYIAPERVRHQQIDARSDVYSLGATLYHALAGRPPFEGATPVEVIRARLDKPPQPLRVHRHDVDRHVEKIIARMLQPEPARRYPTYASLIGDFRRALDGLPRAGGSHAPGAPGQTRRVYIRKREGLPTATTGPLPEEEAEPVGEPGEPALHPPAAHRLSGLTEFQERLSEAEEAARRRRRRRTLQVLLALVLLGALAWGGAEFFRQRRAEEERIIAARRRELARQAQVQAAQDTFVQIGRVVKGLAEAPARAERLLTRVTGPAEAVLGTLPEFPGPAPEARPPETEAPPPDAEPPAEAAAEDDAAEKRKMTDLLQQARSDGAAVAQAVAECRQIASQARDARARVGEAPEAEAAASGVAELGGHLTAVQQKAATIPGLLAKLEAAGTEAAAIEETVRRQRATREATELTRLKAQEREARIAGELAEAGVLAETVAPLIKLFKFEDAVRTVKRSASAFRTEEGARAVQVLTDRCTLLAELHASVIENLSSEGFPWGWDRGRGQFEDVLGADAYGVQLRGGNVPWNKIGLPQMRRFVERALATAARNRPSARGRQYLAAAVWAAEFGFKDVARDYARQAVSAASQLESEVARLLPPD